MSILGTAAPAGLADEAKDREVAGAARSPTKLAEHGEAPFTRETLKGCVGPQSHARVQAIRLSRHEVKAARERARRGDVTAVRLLLSHSVACCHERLSLRRYFFARALGADDLGEFESFCGNVASRLVPDELEAMVRDAVAQADRLRSSLQRVAL